MDFANMQEYSDTDSLHADHLLLRGPSASALPPAYSLAMTDVAVTDVAMAVVCFAVGDLAFDPSSVPRVAV